MKIFVKNNFFTVYKILRYIFIRLDLFLKFFVKIFSNNIYFFKLKNTRSYLNDNINNTYDIIYKDSNLIRNPPCALNDHIHWKFTTESIKAFPEAYVATINNGRVIGSAGFVVTDDNHLLYDLHFPYVCSMFMSEFHKQFFFSKYPMKVNKLAVLSYVWIDNYFHWLFEVLPRIHLIMQKTNEIEYYVMNGIPHIFKEDTLHILGIDKEKIIYANKETLIYAEELICPSLPGESGNIPMWVVNFLRKHYLVQNIHRNKKIYISRKKAINNRRILNETDVVDSLYKFGFETYTLEDLPFRDQVNLFASAEVVIAPHGAGLSNLVFSSSQVKVLEIFSPKYVNPCYYNLCNAIGIQYYYLIGEGKSPKPYKDPHKVSDNIIVDINQLMSAVNRLLSIA